MCGRIEYLHVAVPRRIAKVFEKFVNSERIFLYEPCKCNRAVLNRITKADGSFSISGIPIAAILCPALCIVNIINKAKMCGKSIKYIMSQLLFALHWWRVYLVSLYFIPIGYHWRELPQVSFLSWQNMSFVTTKVCLLWQSFVANKIRFLRQNFCNDKHNFVKSFVMTSILLLWQTWCSSFS